MILIGVYSSRLSSSFTNPQKDFDFNKYKNVHTMVRFGLKAVMNAHFKVMFQMDTAFPDKVKNGDFLFANMTDYEVLRKVAAKESQGTFALKSVISAHAFEAMNVDSRVMGYGHILYTTFFMRKHNQINKVISYWTRRMIECGVTKKIWNDIIESNRNWTFAPTAITHSKRQALRIEHYKEAFQILIWGYGAAVITLGGECLLHRIQNVVYVNSRRFIELPLRDVS